MKRKALSWLLALCLIVGLLPTAALAAENDVGGDAPAVCAELEGCTGYEHDEGCPLYVAPEPADGEEEPEEPPVEETEDPAPVVSPVTALQERIDALPSVEELEEMDTEALAEVYAEVCAIYDAIDELADEEAEALDVSALEAAAAFFTQQIMPLVDETTDGMSGTCGATDSDSVTWKLEQNNRDDDNPTYTLTISGTGAMADFDAPNGSAGTTAPWYSYVASLTKVEIQDGVTYIGARAFRHCTNVEELKIAGTVQTMGVNVASFCSDLKELVFMGESQCTQISTSAFWGCGLTSLTIPASVKTIGGGAFKACTSLSQITFETGSCLETIEGGNGAFSQTAITQFTIPDTVKELGAGTFSGCAKLESITIPSSVQTIGKGVFTNCTSLQSITFEGTSISAIPENFAEGATALSSISIPDTVQTIGKKAFFNCSRLQSVTFGQNSQLLEISDFSVFENCSVLQWINLPNTVKVIGQQAFKNSGVTNVDFSKLTSLRTIGASAFVNCSLGDVLIFPVSLMELKDSAFNNTNTAAKKYSVVDLSRVSDDFSLGTLVFHNSDNAIVYIPSSELYQSIAAVKNGLRGGKVKAITNGGTFADDTSFASNTLSAPGKDDFDFAGWYTDSDFSTEAPKDGDVYTATAGQIYYAKWNSEITFDANGGTGSMEAQTIAETDTSTKLTKNTFAREGYEFSGWNTAADGSGTSYTDEATEAGANGNITLYAQWTKKIGESTNYTVNAILDQTYTGAAIEPAVVVKNGDTVLDSGYTVAYSNNTDVGTAKATVAVGSDTAEVKFKIVKDTSPTVEMADVSVTYGTEYAMTATAKTSAGNEITGGTITIKYYTDEGCTTDEAANAPSSAGTYYAKATLTGTENYAEATTIAKIIISNATFSVSATGYDGTYNGEAHSITVEADGADVTYCETENGTYSSNNPAYTNAGEYTVYYKATKANHDDVTGSATVKIAKVQTSLTLTADPASMNGAGTVKLTVSSTGIPEAATISAPACDGVTVSTYSDGTYSVSLPNETKEYTFTVSYAGDNNYEAATATCTVSVTRRSSGGGGGSSSSGSTTYTVSTDSAKNGSVSVSPKNASKGTTVTITIKPDSGYELDDLTVTDKNGDAVKLTRKSDTQYTFTMPASKVTVEASFTKIEEQPSVSFIDVPTSAYYYDAVAWAVENGITNGTSATTFSPDDSCTRAQMVTFLWRAAGSPKATGGNPFTDVSASAYYYDAVLWAVEQGITNGTSAITFSPDATVTRGQTVTFLWRAGGSPAARGSSFADVAADAYYAPAVQWAVANGITYGTSSTTFGPEDDCTRAQIVTFLWRDMA